MASLPTKPLRGIIATTAAFVLSFTTFASTSLAHATETPTPDVTTTTAPTATPTTSTNPTSTGTQTPTAQPTATETPTQQASAGPASTPSTTPTTDTTPSAQPTATPARAARADQTPPSQAVPQAPTFTVISKAETLPFTIDGDGPIEIATLLDGADLANAEWKTYTENKLPMEPFDGHQVRVLARSANQTDQHYWFDQTYTVQAKYPGYEASLWAGDTRIKGWAVSTENYQPGPNVSDNWKRSSENGGIGQVDPGQDTGSGATAGLVVLGDNGQLTFNFASPITDGAGDDFAVYENGFIVSGTDQIFAELMYVEVTSNGTDWVQFDSADSASSQVGSYAGSHPSRFGGLAGAQPGGSPFDLAVLKNKKEVRSGTIDLTRITQVRVRDIRGCGDETDSFGREIRDPCPTGDSGGADTRGVAVLNQADDVAWLNPATITKLPTGAEFNTLVNANGHGPVEVRLELANSAAGDNTRVVQSVTSTDTAHIEKLQFTADGLTPGTYWYRLVGKQNDGKEIAQSWKSFSTTEVYVGDIQRHTLRWDARGTATVRFWGKYNPYNAGNKQRVFFEYTTDTSTTPEATPGSDWTGDGDNDLHNVYEYAYDLERAKTYSVRMVAIDTVTGNRVQSDWQEISTYAEGSFTVTPSAPTLTYTASGVNAELPSTLFRSGSAREYTVRVDYSTDTNQTTYDSAACGKVTGQSYDNYQLTCTVTGLETGTTYTYRYVVSDGHRDIASPWSAQFSTGATARADLTTVSRVGGSWQVAANVSAPVGNDVVATVTVRQTSAAGEIVSTLAKTATAGVTSRLIFTFTSLDATGALFAEVTFSDQTTWVGTRTVTSASPTVPVVSSPSVSTGPTMKDGTAIATNSNIGGSYGPVVATYQWTSETETGPYSTTSGTVTLLANGRQNSTATLTGLKPGATYSVRAIVTATHPLTSGFSVASNWRQFTVGSVANVLSTARVNSVTETSARIEAAVDMESTTSRFTRDVHSEYRVVGQQAVTKTASTQYEIDPQQGAPLFRNTLTGLTPGTSYEARVVATATAVGDTEATAWVPFTTPKKYDAVIDGACSPRSSGVTVVVDYGDDVPAGSNQVVVRCAEGTQDDGFDALVSAGFTVNAEADGAIDGTVCTIDKIPSTGFPDCWYKGYWSYWHAQPGDVWDYSQLGAGNRVPAVGTVEGWRWVSLQDPMTPPANGPSFEVGEDNTAPVISVSKSREGTSAETTAHINFAVNDLQASLTCQVDTNPAEECPSPLGWDGAERVWNVTGLGSGEHTLTILAKDIWNNEAVKTITFTVGTPAKAITVSASPQKVMEGEKVTFRGATSLPLGQVTLERQVGGAWVELGKATPAGDGSYSLDWTARTPGSTPVRAVWNGIVSEPVTVTVTAKPTLSLLSVPSAPLVGQSISARAKVSVSGTYAVATQVRVGNTWSTSRTGTTNQDGSFTLPVTYGATTAGVYTWRLRATIDGLTVYSREFTITRVAPKPVVWSAPSKAKVGAAVSALVKVPGMGTGVKVSTQFLVGGTWRTSQSGVTNTKGEVTLRLTYGATSPGAYRWRTITSYGTTSKLFTITRTR